MPNEKIRILLLTISLLSKINKEIKVDIKNTQRANESTKDLSGKLISNAQLITYMRHLSRSIQGKHSNFNISKVSDYNKSTVDDILLEVYCEDEDLRAMIAEKPTNKPKRINLD